MIGRRALLGGSASLFGALALTAVAGELTLAEAAEKRPDLDPHNLELFPNFNTVTEQLPVVEPKKLTARERALLDTFDELDFVVFNGRQWDRFAESHSQHIRVHAPDGTITDGLDAHIEYAKSSVLWAPDTRVMQHPLKIAKDNLTAVIGVGSGTFTQPLPLPDGSAIPPNGKRFQFAMVTIGRWNRHGTMDEEILFFDQLALRQQVGLA